MTQSRKTSRTAASKPAAAAVPPVQDDDEVLDTSDLGERISSRPDGYYWQAIDGKQEIGPFDTYAEALADMDSGEAAGWTPGETLAEAESEIGVADWIDPDSGAPAEGQAPTHIERE